jgi:hypothetical protein
MTIYDDGRETLAGELEDVLRGKAKRADQIEALVEFIQAREQDATIYDAYPCNTHAEIETVNIYSLQIGIDGNGHACRVTFPDGAIIDV